MCIVTPCGWFCFFYGDSISAPVENCDHSQRHPTGESKMSSVYTRQSEPQQRILRMRELTKIVGLS
ncbi:hypothetical protein EYA02_23450, partial [Salmonella enterica subsp. enterica serovar Typhimurium]|nr:hypothetical protein [Salmonella enterica subsp. enterica serovar Typhimurium]